MKKSTKSIVLSSVVASSLLVLTGCGGGGSSSSSNGGNTGGGGTPTESKSYNITAVDDAVVSAKIKSNECSSFEEIGNGEYKLTGCTEVPKSVQVDGGFVDANGDGQKGDDEANMGMPLLLKTSQFSGSDDFVVTPLSTLSAGLGADESIDDLAAKLGLSKEDFFKNPKDITDTTAKNKIQDALRTLNAMLVEAKQLGVKDHLAFLKDIRDNLAPAANDGKTADVRLKDVRKAIAAKAAAGDYDDKYGLAFSGFISDPSSNGLDLLKELEEKEKVTPGKVVFSGFIYDGRISNADIELFRIDSNSGNEIAVGGALIVDGADDAAADNGKWKITVDDDILKTDQNLIFRGTATVDSKKVVLETAISTKKLRALFTNKVDTSDLADITISNVTTAKLALIKAIDSEILKNADKLTQKKEVIENNENLKELLKVTSAAIKQVVDEGKSLEIKTDSQTETKDDTKDYADDLAKKLIKKIYADEDVSNVDANEAKKDNLETNVKTELTTSTDIQENDINKSIKDIEESKILSEQLNSTEAVETFALTDALLENKILKLVTDSQVRYNLELFKEGKNFKVFNTFISYTGTWEVLEGKLKLSFGNNLSNTFEFSSLAEDSKGTFENVDRSANVSTDNFTVQNVVAMSATKITDGLKDVIKTFEAYDRTWNNRKSDARYFYLGNGANVNDSNQIIATAKAVVQGESRGEAKVDFQTPVSGIQTTLYLTKADTDGNARASLSTYIEDVIPNKDIFVTVNVRGNKVDAYIWDETSNVQIVSKELLTQGFISTDGSKQVKVNIVVDGSVVEFSATPVSNNVAQSKADNSKMVKQSYDLTNYFTGSSINLDINNARIRAKVNHVYDEAEKKLVKSSSDASLVASTFLVASKKAQTDSSTVFMTKAQIETLISGKKIDVKKSGSFDTAKITYKADGKGISVEEDGTVTNFTWSVSSNGEISTSLNSDILKAFQKDGKTYIVRGNEIVGEVLNIESLPKANEAITLIKTIDPEKENIDSKLAIAKNLVKDGTNTDEKIVALTIELAEILNDDALAEVINASSTDSTINSTSMLNKIVRSDVLDTITLDIGDLADNAASMKLNDATVGTLNKMADKLKVISDEFGNLFTNSSTVYEVDGEKMTYNDSVSTRGMALALAGKMKFLASYKWGTDKDWKNRTYVDGNNNYDYMEAMMDKAKLFNDGNFFKLATASRMDEARNLLKEAADLVKTLPVGHQDVKQKDLDEATAISNSLGNTSVYTITEEDGTKFEIDLAQFFSSTNAIDITSLGSRWQNICKTNAIMLSIEDSYQHGGELNCEERYMDMNNNIIHRENPGADLTPTVLPTLATSKIDEVVKSITPNDPAIKLTGEAMMTLLLEDIEKQFKFEAFGTNWVNYKGDEADEKGYRQNGNNAWVKDGVIHVNAYKANAKRSRAQAVKSFSTPKEELHAQVIASLPAVDDSTGRAALVANLENINSSNENIFTKIELRNGKVVVYAEIEGNSTPLADSVIATTDVNEDYIFDLSIKIDGNKIKYNVSKTNKQTNQKDPFTEFEVEVSNATDLGIDSAKFRSEIREDKAAYENIEGFTKLKALSFNAMSKPSINNTFGSESLLGKTFYFVWFGTGEKPNGDEIQDVAVVERVVVGNNGSVTITGLKNANNDTGFITFADNKMFSGNTTETINFKEYNKYISGSLSSGCIKTQWVNTTNANDNNVDLMFSDETNAMNFANGLTATITDCPSN